MRFWNLSGICSTYRIYTRVIFWVILCFFRPSNTQARTWVELAFLGHPGKRQRKCKGLKSNELKTSEPQNINNSLLK